MTGEQVLAVTHCGQHLSVLSALPVVSTLRELSLFPRPDAPLGTGPGNRPAQEGLCSDPHIPSWVFLHILGFTSKGGYWNPALPEGHLSPGMCIGCDQHALVCHLPPYAQCPA